MNNEQPIKKFNPKYGDLVAFSNSGKKEDWIIGVFLGYSQNGWAFAQDSSSEYLNMYKYCEPITKHFGYIRNLNEDSDE